MFGNGRPRLKEIVAIVAAPGTCQVGNKLSQLSDADSRSAQPSENNG
jgi:hypothetical protein